MINDPDDDSDYEDTTWTFCDERPEPTTVTVEDTASNAYGGPIFLMLQQAGRKMGVFLDEDTWEQLHQAGLRAAEVRRQRTEDGWT